MKKILVLGLVLMLCLAVIGSGYAMWSKTLTVSGTVATGNIGAIFSSSTCTDNEIEGKDVSGAVCTIGTTGDMLTIAISNAYPSITYLCTYTITGTGSVPVHFSAPVINRGTLPASAELVVSAVSPIQVHANGTATGSISLHLLNTTPTVPGAEENQSYTFGATLEYHQYNE